MAPLFTLIFARKPKRKITANYTPRSVSALSLAMELSGDTQTATLNRSVQTYAYLLHLREQGQGRDAEVVTRLLGQL